MVRTRIAPDASPTAIDPRPGARLIFVGGPARSGTTLVQNILDSHPDICGAPEFHHIPAIMRLRFDLNFSIDRKWIDLICSYDDVDQQIRSLIENLLYPLADKHQCRFLSEKSPENVQVFSELLDLFPAAHFIFIVRDPRATISSILNVGKRAKKHRWRTRDFTHSLVLAISYVQKCLHSGFKAYKAAPQRVRLITYEQLVADPAGESRALCEYLNIGWTEQMLHPSALRHLGEKAITNDVWYDKKSYYRDPDPRDIDKWRRQLSFLQKVVIAAAFYRDKDLAACGYDMSDTGAFGIDAFLGRTMGPIASFSAAVMEKPIAIARRGKATFREALRLVRHIASFE